MHKPLVFKGLLRFSVFRTTPGDIGATALAASASLASVVVLDLSYNRIGNAGAAALANSRHLTNVRHLLLGNNHIGDDGALMLRRRFGDRLVL